MRKCKCFLCEKYTDCTLYEDEKCEPTKVYLCKKCLDEQIELKRLENDLEGGAR